MRASGSHPEPKKGGNQMQMALMDIPERKPIGKLAVVRNFRRVIEARDINLMKPKLYDFLIMHCGFIAHFNIDGFKTTYRRPNDFAEVFIRHFDREHRYYHGIYACHREPYKDSGFTKAEIKQAFEEIVDLHKDRISRWARDRLGEERYSLYLSIKSEFEPDQETPSLPL
jgi:hypothetical protein